MRSVLVIACAAALVLVGCGGSSKSKNSSNNSSPHTAAADSLTIKGFKFSPNPITVKAGATVTVTNQDGNDHTVTADDNKSFDTKHIHSGSTTTFKAPDTKGTYTFHCTIHSYMTDKLVVV